MARRSSGQVNVNLTYVDSKDAYRASVSVCGNGRETVWVGPPRHLRHAVDSPVAYDEAARAAIAFAERVDAGSHAEWDKSGNVRISRRASRCRR